MAVTTMHFTTTGDEGFEPSVLITEEDKTASLSKNLFTVPSPAGTTRTGVWHAEPGTYRHPGGGNETFVVLEGTAEFEMPTGTVHLEPGVVCHIPADVPTVMVVTSTLRKVSVIVSAA